MLTVLTNATFECKHSPATRNSVACIINLLRS